MKERYEREGAARSRWVVDEAIPIFSHEDGRAYVARFTEPPLDDPSDAVEANED